NFNSKNQKTYDDFEKQRAINEAKVAKWHDLALSIREKSDDLVKFIKELKVIMIKKVDGPDTKAIQDGEVIASLIEAKDNSHVGDEVMIGPTGEGKGLDLRRKMEDYRNYLLSLVPDKPENQVVRNSILKNLDTTDPPPKEGESFTWQYSMFAHYPIAAVITMLTKIEADIRNAEADVLKFLYGQIDISDFKFNKLEGLVIPKSNMVISGEEFSASVFIAARDSTQDPKIYVGSYQKEPDGSYKMVGSYQTLPIQNGVGVFRTTSRKIGTNEWGGLIEMQAPDGTVKRYPFKNTFTVNEPLAIISASANTVFYSGVENPLEVSVPGLNPDKITPSITGPGKLTRRGKDWVVTPNPGAKGIIEVTLTVDIDGKKQKIGTKDFRIFPVPNPVPKVADQMGGTIARTALESAGEVKAVLENFIMENIKYTVKSYTVVTKDPNGFDKFIQNSGAKFNDQVSSIVRGLKRRDRITFENIIATGPDGDRNIGTIAFTIN
ncbi:MAG TPA: GldM family protein, partial [Salinivirgaceae bacterium]|nr:GldM family protein [Salinivirgaceae bacterium]